jgi:hypothetical protein
MVPDVNIGPGKVQKTVDIKQDWNIQIKRRVYKWSGECRIVWPA